MKTSTQNIDQVNLSNVKVNLSKGNKKLLTKESVSSRKEIYLGSDQKTNEEKKKFRGWIRRELKRFVNQILGKDRTDSERIDSIEKFISFYKKHWKITDFKLENFSQCKNDMDLKDYRELLDYVKETLEEGTAEKKEKKNSKIQKIKEVKTEVIDSVQEGI